MKQVMKITSFGVEKISVSTHALNNISFLKNISHKIGRQSLSVTINIKKIDDQYSIFSHNGKKKYEGLLLDFIYQIKDIVGEIVINDIDKDGTMNGINTEIVEIINHHISVPLIIIGGAGSINHVREVIEKNHIIGVGCASLFVFKGKNKAVLINYPKDQIFRNL